MNRRRIGRLLIALAAGVLLLGGIWFTHPRPSPGSHAEIPFRPRLGVTVDGRVAPGEYPAHHTLGPGWVVRWVHDGESLYLAIQTPGQGWVGGGFLPPGGGPGDAGAYLFAVSLDGDDRVTAHHLLGIGGQVLPQPGRGPAAAAARAAGGTTVELVLPLRLPPGPWRMKTLQPGHVYRFAAAYHRTSPVLVAYHGTTRRSLDIYLAPPHESEEPNMRAERRRIGALLVAASLVVAGLLAGCGRGRDGAPAGTGNNQMTSGQTASAETTSEQTTAGALSGGETSGGTAPGDAAGQPVASPPTPPTPAAGTAPMSLTPWEAAVVEPPAPRPEGIVVFGRVTDESGQPVPGGVVALERGRLHNNRFEVAAQIHPDGTYSVKLSGAGDWGIHVYADGFIYQPEQLQVGRVVDKEFNVTLVRQPTGMNAPQINAPLLEVTADGRLHIQLEATDNQKDLSPQVLALNISFGQAFVLNPPSPPNPEIPGVKFAEYPNGVYSATVNAEGVGQGKWVFLAANHHCAISTLIRLEAT